MGAIEAAQESPMTVSGGEESVYCCAVHATCVLCELDILRGVLVVVNAVSLPWTFGLTGDEFYVFVISDDHLLRHSTQQ